MACQFEYMRSSIHLSMARVRFCVCLRCAFNRSIILLTPFTFRKMAVGLGDRTDQDSMDSLVTKQCLEELLEYFHNCSYRARTMDRRVSTRVLHNCSTIKTSCGIMTKEQSLPLLIIWRLVKVDTNAVR